MNASHQSTALTLLCSATLLVSGCVAASPAPMLVTEAMPAEMIVPGTDATCTVGYPEYPSMSPDGSLVVFAWAGDLWASPIQGGTCSRLTVHPADERRSAFSPDGSMLAFESTRDGARNLYVMPITKSGGVVVGGTARRITASDRPQSLGGFTSDGKALLFASTLDPSIYRSPRIYRVELAGPATPTEVGEISGGPVSMLSQAFGQMPQMSGDGSSVLFTRGYAPLDRPKYRGTGQIDVWRMNTKDNSFTQITRDAANDSDPWTLPDGSIVFISSRDGVNNLWRVGPGGEAGGAAVQLTNFKASADQLTIAHGVRDLAVSADGKTAVFCVWDRMYRLSLGEPNAQPQPIDVVAAADDSRLDIQRINVDREVSEAVLSPDGKTLAVVARGEIFVRNTGEGYPTRRVTNTIGRERDLAWSPDGRVLYFASDDAGLAAKLHNTPDSDDNLGKYSVYAATVTLAREDIAPDKKKDEAEAKPEAKKDEPKAEPKTEPAADKPAEPKKDAEAKPDDAKPADDKKDEKKDAPKSKKPDFGKRWSEALTFSITGVATDTTDIRVPVPSPDAKLLIVTHGLGDQLLINLETGQKRELFKSWDDAEVQWASDSRHIVYAVSDLDFNSDIFLMDTGGVESFAAGFTPAAPINLTRHPDVDSSPRLSADGKVLTFLSQRGEQNDQVDVYQVYLDRELEGMTSYERDEYFKKASEAAGKRKPAETPAFVTKKASDAKPADPKPADAKAEEKPEAAKAKKPEGLKFDADDAYLRIRRITSSPGSKGSLQVTPGADRIVFSGLFDSEQPSLVSVDPKGGDRKVIQAGAVSGLTMSLTGDKVAFIRQGVANSAPTKGGKVDALAIDAPITIDVSEQQRQKFLELARTFGDRFYHPTMKDLEWRGLTRRYVELASKTRSSESFNRVANHLFGECDGSHTGASGGPSFSGGNPATGYLGIRDRAVPGGYEVTHIFDDGPADQRQSKLNVGDVIVSVDGRRLAADDASMPMLDLDAALMGRAGRETLIEVRRAAKAVAAEQPKTDAAQKEVAKADAKGNQFLVIVPTSSAGWTALGYRDEVNRRRELVEKLSGGKLGYLHIRGMGEPEVRDYERDLFAAANGKEGLVIDVRDNGGGWTADILLASLTAPRHAYTIPRGADPASVPHDAYPRDRRLIYAWTRPLNVLINQNSFSNAEIFAHAIKTTKRGTLVGTATFGGVISTGAFSLIDGTNIRMPFRGWYLPDGTDMENNGAKPDIDVAQVPGDEVAGKDAQLEAAVSDLMKKIGKNAASK